MAMNIEITDRALYRLLRRLNDGTVTPDGVEQWAAVFDDGSVRLDCVLHGPPYTPVSDMTIELDVFGRVKR